MGKMALSVARREALGKNNARRMRKSGAVPGVLYGEALDPVPITVQARDLDLVFHSESGTNALLELALEGTGQSRLAMVKDFQLHPVSGQVIHADFIRINAEREVQVSVHVELEGLADGVKNHGGFLEFSHREIAVSCLPNDIPAAIKVDVSDMGLDDVIHVGDIGLPEGVVSISDPKTPICAVHAPKVDKTETEEEEEGAEAAEGAETPPAGGEGETKSE